jgi:alkanesulfonate monooxygenase SsuD/methylene tetrahydromethanopterin reductase-like flavin-dependent oxidoreductase (luciferase family)
MKKIGFLSFGHWSRSPGSQTRSAADALQQSIELAVAAEELGADGAYFRVHHFARQLASPFPLLAAVGARTSRIEIGTGVIDMRYENPLYMAEDAGAADLIAGGRLQLGISRGSPEQVIDGFRYFGYIPAEGSDHAAMAREHTRVFLDVIKGEGFARPNPRPMFPNPPGLLRIEPHSPGLSERIWWGAGTRATAEWTAQQGLNLMSSTLLSEDTGVPFHHSRPSRSSGSGTPGRPPATSGSRGSRSAAASSRSSPTWTGHTSAPPGETRTRSATSRAAPPGSARPTPASPTSW